MDLRIDASGGLIRLACAPYDETIVGWIRTLPRRRYRRESHDWSVPARREYLRSVCGVIAELQEREIEVDITEPAAARLSRLDVGRGVLRGGAIEIAGPYSERRLPALRALPERRFDAERRIWTVPLTRAGALAILALADGGDELVIALKVGGRVRRQLDCADTRRSLGVAHAHGLGEQVDVTAARAAGLVDAQTGRRQYPDPGAECSSSAFRSRSSRNSCSAEASAATTASRSGARALLRASRDTTNKVGGAPLTVRRISAAYDARCVSLARAADASYVPSVPALL